MPDTTVVLSANKTREALLALADIRGWVMLASLREREFMLPRLDKAMAVLQSAHRVGA